jgi:mono/diheme cytochrome c family protein
MLKPLPLVSVVALFAIALLNQQNAAAQAPAKNPAKTIPQLQDKAKQLYKIDCALCHNVNGDGKTDIAKDMELNLVDWTDPKTLADQPDQELFNIIRNGKGKMPPEEVGRAKDDEVKALIQYIRSFAANTPATPAPAAAPPAAAAAPGQ